MRMKIGLTLYVIIETLTELQGIKGCYLLKKEEKMVVVVEDDIIKIEKLPLGPFGTNAYIVVCQKTKDSVLIDAPAEANTILERLKGTNPKYILLTHNHMDHTGALSELHSSLKIPLAAHTSDAGNLPSSPEMLLNDGDTIQVGELKIEVIHTPGHTSGCICLY